MSNEGVVYQVWCKQNGEYVQRGWWNNKFSASAHVLELLAEPLTVVAWIDEVTTTRLFFASGPADKA